MFNGARIKICGITNLEDARAAVDYGADALGFIFVPATPRFVGDRAEMIVRHLPPFVARVAVCIDSAQAHTGISGFDTVQYYRQDGSMPPSMRRLPAFRMRDESSLDEIATALQSDPVPPHALLLDAYHPDRMGGAGVAFNWQLAVEAKSRFGLPVVLAGGLTPDNVGHAVRMVQPYAVDVSSGVEAAPGRKDHAKLRAFIAAVKTA